MRKGWKLVCLFCLAAVMFLAVAGCGGKPSIVGTWQSQQDTSTYVEFTQNGQLIINTGGRIVTWAYELLSDDYVKINITGLAGVLTPLFNKSTWKYTVTKSDLTMSADSTTKTFKRVK